MIDLALHYISRGWPVFPLHGKKPLEGSHSFLDATLDVNRAEGMWRADPDANIGIATGRRSGVLVIDIDPRKTESVRALQLPPTLTVRTWSGGWHLYLAFDGDPRITIGSDLLPGIDWRGNGGYVVAPGSVVNDITYTIAKNLPIAQAPASLLERIIQGRRRPRVEHDNRGHAVIPSGRRNDTLISIAGCMRRWGVEYNALVAALRAVNADHCRPALDDHELQQIAASAARYAPGTDEPRERA
jgi:hypothetical protein